MLSKKNMMILLAFERKVEIKRAGQLAMDDTIEIAEFVASYSLKKRESVKQYKGTRLTCATHLFNQNDITRQQSIISAVTDH